ncbi:MAG TPA: D-alanyl-D-alanine carboxypeptidase [Candidatus Kaiserbacteria bacterium]|nr:D-alanyl-D-alanine carboxypeptidase [Candidatus Kaiserbacteria bacterium]
MDDSGIFLLNTRSRRIAAGTVIFLFVFAIGITLYVHPYQLHDTTITAKSKTTDAFSSVSIVGKAAIVYDLTTDKILFSKNAHAQLPLASITKLLTVYTAVKYLGIHARIPITHADVAVDGDSGFDPGEVFALEPLAGFTLAGSINDGAVAIARATASRVKKSIPELLSSVAQASGLTQIYALNGSGLDSSATVSGGYGSPYDVAILAGKLLNEAPGIASFTTKSTTTITSINGIVHTKQNTDPYVTDIAGIRLSKTGYTNLAGGNLVVVFDASFGHPVAIVVLGSTEKDRFTDVLKLIKATRSYLANVQ